MNLPQPSTPRENMGKRKLKQGTSATCTNKSGRHVPVTNGRKNQRSQRRESQIFHGLAWITLENLVGHHCSRQSPICRRQVHGSIGTCGLIQSRLRDLQFRQFHWVLPLLRFEGFLRFVDSWRKQLPGNGVPHLGNQWLCGCWCAKFKCSWGYGLIRWVFQRWLGDLGLGNRGFQLPVEEINLGPSDFIGNSFLWFRVPEGFWSWWFR